MNTHNRPRIPEIVHRPDLVTTTKRGMLAIIAMLGWALWLYLLMPFGALLAWWFGYKRLNLFVLAVPGRTMETVAIYAIVISVAGALLIFWAVYNWLRFGKYDHRGISTPVDAQAISEYFSISTEAVLTARQNKISVFHFNDEGQIIYIETFDGVDSERCTPKAKAPQKTSSIEVLSE